MNEAKTFEQYSDEFKAIATIFMDRPIPGITVEHHIPPDDDIYSTSYSETLHVNFHLTPPPGFIAHAGPTVAYAMFHGPNGPFAETLDGTVEFVLCGQGIMGRRTNLDFELCDPEVFNKIIDGVKRSAIEYAQDFKGLSAAVDAYINQLVESWK